jgi:hypothetical protein
MYFQYIEKRLSRCTPVCNISPPSSAKDGTDAAAPLHECGFCGLCLDWQQAGMPGKPHGTAAPGKVVLD